MHSFTFTFYVGLFLPRFESWSGSASRRPKSLRNYRYSDPDPQHRLSTKTGTASIWLRRDSCYGYLAVMKQLLPGWAETAVVGLDWNSCYLAGVKQLLSVPGPARTAVVGLDWNSCYLAVVKQLLPGWAGTAVVGLDWNSCYLVGVKQLLPVPVPGTWLS